MGGRVSVAGYAWGVRVRESESERERERTSGGGNRKTLT
jgi:hypothetical protein